MELMQRLKGLCKEGESVHGCLRARQKVGDIRDGFVYYSGMCVRVAAR